MSKASDTRFQFKDGSQAQVGWAEVEPGQPRVPLLTYKSRKRLAALPDEALAFARWILATFEHAPHA